MDERRAIKTLLLPWHVVPAGHQLSQAAERPNWSCGFDYRRRSFVLRWSAGVSVFGVTVA
jgi:hypothetical protein